MAANSAANYRANFSLSTLARDMDESVFIAAADATLDKIGLALDAALETSDADLDWSLRDGVLTIECDDGSRIIVNRHVPNREMWVAAKTAQAGSSD